ncbi:MAG: MFS transporter [Bacillota bacterium]
MSRLCVLEEGMMISKYFFNKDFFLLWLGRSVSQMGDGAGFIAVMWWVQEETGSALALGTLAMSQGLVAVCLGPLAGVIADRLDRKKIIIATDVVRGLIYCSLGYLALTGSLTLLLLIVLSCLSVACSQFFFSAVSAAVPLIVPADGLEKANALGGITAQMVRIAGYAAGGIFVAFFGIPVLLMLNGLSFLLSALSEAFISIPSVLERTETLRVQMLLSDLKDAISYIMRNAVLVKVILVAMVLNVFCAPLNILLPKFVSDFMGADSAVYGYLLSAMMAGGLIGNLVLSTTELVQRNTWIVKWGVSIESLVLALLPVMPVHMWSLHIGIFLAFGCLNGMINVYLQTLIQRMTRPDYMGKVFGLLGTGTGALQPLGQGLTGAASVLFSMPTIFFACFAGWAATGLWFALIPGLDTFLQGGARMPEAAMEGAGSDG